MEAALLERNPVIAARRKAMNYGPLCDVCLAQWRDKYEEVQPIETPAPPPSPPSELTALERLEAACMRMTPESEDSVAATKQLNTR